MHAGNKNSEELLIETFYNSGSEVYGSEVYFWAKLDKNYNSVDKLKKLVDKVAKDIGVSGVRTLYNNVVSDGYNQRVELQGETIKNKAVNIKAILEGPEKDNAYISICIKQEMSCMGLYDSKEEILNVLNKYKINPQINISIYGKIDGKVDSEKTDKLLDQILRAGSAKKVEGVRDNNYVSITAYTNKIKDFILVNNKKVNLNLAMRYNPNENYTYVWLATPLILTGY